MPAIKKSPPWETFYHEVEMLFDGDPDIAVMRQYTDTKKTINLYVETDEKYRLLLKYLPDVKKFGIVDVYLNVIPANARPESTPQEDMKTLFGNNKKVSKVQTVGIPGGEVTYVAFRNGVAQFYDDNLADLNRNKTMLMETIARDVLKLPIDGVYFCTDIPEKTEAVKPVADKKKVSKKDFDETLKFLDNLLML